MRPLASGLATTYRTIAVDVAGHGDSDVPAPADAGRFLSIPGQADSVLAVLDHLDVRRAVLIGHSAGAAVAVQIAAQREGLAEAVVALDGTLLLNDEIRAGTPSLLEALRAPTWRETLKQVAQQTQLLTDDPSLLEAELANIGAIEQHVMLAVPEQLETWDEEAALGSLAADDVPMLYVDASRMAQLDRMAELVPSLAVARAADAGHLQLIGRPRQALAMIEDFLRARTGRMPVDNAAPVLALWHAIEAGELCRIDELVSADFVDHGAPPGLVPPGPEGYRTILSMLRQELELRWDVLGFVASGERVMTWVRNHGRHVGPFLGIAPTGREFAFEAMHTFRVEDGVIREHWAVRDDLALFRALGVDAIAPDARLSASQV
jgi:pimeloyl-ACP methyl ester carboxylesterase/predicted ester cyclase